MYYYVVRHACVVETLVDAHYTLIVYFLDVIIHLNHDNTSQVISSTGHKPDRSTIYLSFGIQEIISEQTDLWSDTEATWMAKLKSGDQLLYLSLISTCCFY